MPEKRLSPQRRAGLMLGLCLLLGALILLVGGPGAQGAAPRQGVNVGLTATSAAATLQALAGTATALANDATRAALQQQAATLAAQLTATAAALTPATSTPVPTRTATPTRLVPSPTPRTAATAAPAARAEVQSLVQGLNVRSGPGTNYDVVGSAALGQIFPASGQSGGCAWLRITLSGSSSGWVSGSPAYTQLSTSCGNLPAVSAPAPVAPAAVAPAPAAPRTAAAPASRTPGLLTAFEPLGNWRRGDQPYGTLASSGEQVADGAAAAKLEYNFPASAGTENYVVFLAQPPLPIPSGASTLHLKVYGDGAGHFLNAWVGDAGGCG